MADFGEELKQLFLNEPWQNHDSIISFVQKKVDWILYSYSRSKTGEPDPIYFSSDMEAFLRDNVEVSRMEDGKGEYHPVVEFVENYGITEIKDGVEVFTTSIYCGEIGERKFTIYRDDVAEKLREIHDQQVKDGKTK